MMMTPPDISVHSRVLTCRRYRSWRSGRFASSAFVRRHYRIMLATLAALVLAAGVERLIYLEIGDHIAAILLALVVVMIVVVTLAPGTRPRRS